MWEFLLKYSPVIFREGEVTVRYLPSVVLLLLMGTGLTAALWFAYKRTTLKVSRALKYTLATFKFLVLALLLFLAFEPVLTVSTVIPHKSSLVLLVDDSKSMSISDVPKARSRLQWVKRTLGDETRPGLLAELTENFKVQTYGFSAQVEHLRDCGALAGEGQVTNLAEGLKFAAQLADQGAVSGVVLFTDGAHNTDEDPLQLAALLKSKKVPVYVVGVGSEHLPDVEIAKVSANHSVIENSVVELAALIKSTTFNQKEIELELREDGAIVKKEKVKLQGSATRVAMKFSPQKRGFVRYTLTALAGRDEAIKENNSRTFLVDNRDKKASVLYIEGYPRAEFKYIRRALHGDPNIRLVSLLRTGLPDKFYRQGIASEDELKHGYPKTRAELFKYDAIIFGSIEAAFFTTREMQNTAAFVSQRGGGFLMLGGVPAFAEGGYQGTPIEPILPVELGHVNEADPSARGGYRDRFRLQLTAEGYRSPILQLSTDERENRELWDKLPELEGYNPLGKAKPGATVLAVHPLSQRDNPRIILAHQRYGRGRTMVFATSSSWHWQMGMPHEDRSHERFWRQMLRWLALSAPKPVECALDKETYAPYEPVTINVDVRDSTYNYIENATIKAIITTPSGETVEVPFNWSSNGKVEYTGTYHPDAEGLYRVAIQAHDKRGRLLGQTEAAFYVEKSRAEFTRAQLQSGLLKRIAELTGGYYYHEEEAADLPDQISVMKSSYSKLVEHDLWDMPLVFLLVVVLLTLEWSLRRGKGLS